MAGHKNKADFLDGYKYYDPEQEGYGNASEWKRNFSSRMSNEEAEVVLENEDPWTILGINHSASKSEIKGAFYHMAMYWHPDVSPEPVDIATKMMQKINAAYSLLTNIRKN